ncbi:MAG: NAD(P)-dependent alcohol dehydrogenase [Saprospiraceae bacterium]|nr:NAD(P)-dependent alcohol dehydrogenase [Saprospiraceae bacterium]
MVKDYPDLCPINNNDFGMKAAIYERYGAPEVVQVKNVPQPVPGANDLLIRIYATSVSSGDARIRRADPFAARLVFGLFKPKRPILGYTFSGVVAATGAGVTHFKSGDEVFGSTDMTMGAHAEYLCLPENGVVIPKPAQLSHEEAACLPFGAHTALHYLQLANIQPGQKVLIFGASGAVGTAAVQIARIMGAQVTGVCSTANLELVRSLGADEVLDYTNPAHTPAPESFGVVYETVNKTPLEACFSPLKKGGKLILGAALLKGMIAGHFNGMLQGKKVLAGVALNDLPKLRRISEWATEGRLKVVIDKTYSIEEIAEAHRLVDSGRKRGAVAVRV